MNRRKFDTFFYANKNRPGLKSRRTAVFLFAETEQTAAAAHFLAATEGRRL